MSFQRVRGGCLLIAGEHALARRQGVGWIAVVDVPEADVTRRFCVPAETPLRDDRRVESA